MGKRKNIADFRTGRLVCERYICMGKIPVINRDYKRDYRLLTSPFRIWPDFVIPGEAKCGTTTLYSHLTRHPDIYAADVKEPGNFIKYPDSGLFCKAHYPLWVRRFLREKIVLSKLLSGEASAEYFSKKDVPKKLAAMLPNIKIIILMRNPVMRAYSDYQMLKNHGLVKESFEDIVLQSINWIRDTNIEKLIDAVAELEHNPLRYVMRGIYVRSLRNWVKYYPIERIKILKSEELFEQPKEILAEVFKYLGVKPVEFACYDLKKRGRYDTAIGPRLAERLAKFYRPYNEELYELIGRDMRWEFESVETVVEQ